MYLKGPGTNGIPQGSEMGSFLYIIYTSNLGQLNAHVQIYLHNLASYIIAVIQAQLSSYIIAVI